jgi:WD40 repeat protein
MVKRAFALILCIVNALTIIRAETNMDSSSAISKASQQSATNIKKMSREQQNKLRNNHLGRFFRDTAPAEWELKRDLGWNRKYERNFDSVEVSITDHGPGGNSEKPSPDRLGGKSESPHFTAGTFQEFAFTATFSYNLNVSLAVGSRYTVEFEFHEDNWRLRSDDIASATALEEINGLLATWASVIDLNRLASDTGWQNAPPPSPPPDLLNRLKPNVDPNQQGDLASVMEAIKDQPTKVQEWAKMFYEYALANDYFSSYYDAAKVALKCTEQRLRDPHRDIARNILDTDFRDCVFRPNIERYGYKNAKEVLRMAVPAGRLEKVAQLTGKLLADKVLADPARPQDHVGAAMDEARAIADKPERSDSDEIEHSAKKKDTTGAVNSLPTPNPSPLATRHGDPEVMIEDLGSMPQKRDAMVISENGLHIAFVLSTADNKMLNHDGKPGPTVDDIATFTGTNIPAVFFNKDGTHIAYVAQREGAWFVSVDGKEIVLTSAILESLSGNQLPVSYKGADSMKFSPGGEHFAYIAEGVGDTLQMILDGKQGSAFYRIEPMIFSEQGDRYAYVAHPDRDHAVVVVDGKAGPTFREIKSLRFSSDGKHLAYLANDKGTTEGWKVVLDGEAGPEYVEVEALQFSATGHLAYLAKKDAGKGANPRSRFPVAVVFDGKELGEYERVDQLQFSSDGNHLAFVCTTGDGKVAVLDGKPGLAYDTIYRLKFSPDGSRIVYEGGTRAGTVLVTDDKDSIPIEKINKLTFSQNGKMVAFTAETHNGCVAIVDGVASKPYRFCIDIAVSPDGSRYAYAMDRSINQPEVVVNGKMSVAKSVAGLEQDSEGATKVFAFSPDSRHLAIASKTAAGAASIAVDGATIPAVRAPVKFVFSPDSSHFACLAYGDQNGTTVVFDEKVIEVPKVLYRDNRQLLKPDAFAFRSDGKLKFIGAKNGRIYRVSITPGVPVAAN